MDTFDVAIQQLSKGIAEKISRRDLIKLIAKVTVAGMISSFGIHRDSEPDAILACPGCTIPCDNRLVCKQYAIHYEPCSYTGDCGGRPFYRSKHACSRCCWPIQCSCGGWSQTDLGCVFDPDCVYSDNCSSCGSPENCPGLT